jgi:hypothetical protein
VEEKKMKRLISLALMSLMLLTLHLAAYADGSFSVEYRGCTSGEEYALFILKDNNWERKDLFNPDNILFMDQLTSKNDAVSVLFIAPNFTEGTALLSGVFPDGGPSPRKIGALSEKIPAEKPIKLPAMLTELERSAFEGGKFTHVYLGDNVTSIGPWAFANCRELMYIYIPDSVTSIADDAFYDSPNVVIGCHVGAVSRYAAEHGISCKIVD